MTAVTPWLATLACQRRCDLTSTIFCNIFSSRRPLHAPPGTVPSLSRCAIPTWRTRRANYHYFQGGKHCKGKEQASKQCCHKGASFREEEPPTDVPFAFSAMAMRSDFLGMATAAG